MENNNKKYEDLEGAVNFLNEKIKLAQIAQMDVSNRLYATSQKEDVKMYLQIGNHLKELLRYRNNAPTLLIDLSELPKEYTLEDFISHYRNDGVLVVDTINNKSNQQANTRFIH